MLFAGLGHPVGQPRGAGVVLAHGALKLGELVDHLRGQIGLGHPRGQRRDLGVGTDARGQIAGQFRDAGDPLGLAAQPVVEGDLRQRRGHALQPRFTHRAQIVFPEEAGIRQPRRKHLAVAGQDGGAVIGGLAVGHGDEALDPAACGVAHRKELLVLLHRGAQHLRRQLEEGLAYLAHQHHRPFHQPRDLAQQALVLHQLQPLGEGQVGGLVADVPGPFGMVEQHMRLLQLRHVIVEACNGKGLRRHEAVASRGIRGGDAVHLQRDHPRAGLVGEQAQDGVQRTHPAQRARPPAHGLGPGKLADGPLKHLGHDLVGRAAGALDHREPDLALPVLALLELFLAQPGGAQEARQRLLGRIHPRAPALFAHGGAFARQALDRKRQPARGGEGPGGGIGQPGLHQPVGDQPPEILAGAGLHAGGDFLGIQFDQKIGHHSVLPGGGGHP